MNIYPADKIRNITLLGHSGSGKTSVVESLLYNTKAIDRMGKITDGNTTTDFEEEETRRGISINTTYAACEWKGHKINLVDCPGEFDFTGEQQLGLRAADLALVVASAKDGYAVGAEKAMRLTEKRQIPVAILVNRMDEPNADFTKTVEAFQAAKGAAVVPFEIPLMEGQKIVGIVDILHNKAYKLEDRSMTEQPVPADLQSTVEAYHNSLMEQIAETSEEMMDKFFSGETFTKDEMENGIRNAIATRALFPVLCYSAVLNQGSTYLLDTMISYFPKPDQHKHVKAFSGSGDEVELKCDPKAPLAAQVFKTIVDPFVGRISIIRVFQGTFAGTGSVYNATKEKEERINGVFVLRGKKQLEVDHLEAGDLGAVAKLVNTQTNDTLTTKENVIKIDPVTMPVPCLTRALIPAEKGGEDKIVQGLNKLSDEDICFTIHNDAETHQLLLSGQGEIELDILCAKLKSKYGTVANLEEPRVAYRETIRKKVKVQGRHKKQSGGHGQYGDVWIVFEPGEKEELEFQEEVFGGAVPKNYFPAVEKGLQEAVTEGVLAGYPVVNLKATLVDGSYHDVDSNEMSFKLAARLAYKNGLPQANPVLLEPIASVKVHIPEDNLGDIMGDMSKRRGRILGMGADSDAGYQVVEAEAPMAELSKYSTDLRSMTQGRGWFTVQFARYEQAPGDVSEKVIAAAEKPEE